MATLIDWQRASIGAPTREEWLETATVWIRTGLLHEHGLDIAERVRVSVGWPSRGGLARKRTVIGQCWPPTVSADETVEIFISPKLSDPLDVLGVLVHELVHAAIGTKHKHDRTFAAACTRVGLEGKPTATVPGAELLVALGVLAGDLGVYPHAAIDYSKEEKKSAGRMLKAYCQNDECEARAVDTGRGEPGFKVRITRVWVEALRYQNPELEALDIAVISMPCPFCGDRLLVELPEEDDDKGEKDGA